MTSDPDEHAKNLERWMSEDLAMFGVTSLERVGGGQMMSGLHMAGQEQHRSILMSAGTSFQDHQGRLITVTSHRRDDDNFEMRRRHAPVNTYFAVLRETAEPGERRGVTRRIGPRDIPDIPEFEWTPTTIPVDGEAIPFEHCRFDNGFWTAAGRVEAAEITVDSHGVPLEGLALEHLDELPPELPPPPTPAPRPTREFPVELTNAAVPALILPSAAVDVIHRGRFDSDGGLRGTVCGASVKLTLELPRSASSATGQLDGEPVDVAWSLSDNSGGDPELPATLQGSLGERQVALFGVFRLGPGYWFDRASVEGILADVELTASIERASGGLGGSSTVVANGRHGEMEFEVFASVNGTLDHGILRGAYDGQAIYIDARETDSGGTRISGTCPTPPPFALLLIASLIFFV